MILKELKASNLGGNILKELKASNLGRNIQFMIKLSFEVLLKIHETGIKIENSPIEIYFGHHWKRNGRRTKFNCTRYLSGDR
jgi:hypothetical protein